MWAILIKSKMYNSLTVQWSLLSIQLILVKEARIG